MFLIKIKKKTLFYFYIINIIHKYFFKDADDQAMNDEIFLPENAEIHIMNTVEVSTVFL